MITWSQTQEKHFLDTDSSNESHPFSFFLMHFNISMLTEVVGISVEALRSLSFVCLFVSNVSEHLTHTSVCFKQGIVQNLCMCKTAHTNDNEDDNNDELFRCLDLEHPAALLYYFFTMAASISRKRYLKMTVAYK